MDGLRCRRAGTGADFRDDSSGRPVSRASLAEVCTDVRLLRLPAGLSSPTCGVSAASSCALARGAVQLRAPGRVSVIAAGFLAVRPIQAT
jgi:hypothetical protein